MDITHNITILDRIRHRLNPMHVYCRLTHFGISSNIAREICKIYETVIYKPTLGRWKLAVVSGLISSNSMLPGSRRTGECVLKAQGVRSYGRPLQAEGLFSYLLSFPSFFLVTKKHREAISSSWQMSSIGMLRHCLVLTVFLHDTNLIFVDRLSRVLFVWSLFAPRDSGWFALADPSDCDNLPHFSILSSMLQK